MNVISPPRPVKGKGIVFTEDVSAISAFQEPSCPALIWSRNLPSGIQNWIESIDPDHLPKGRIILRPDAVENAVKHLFEKAHTPAGVERDWLLQDFKVLAKAFSALMNAEYIRLRLDVVTTNACHKFHVDAVTGRLVCTYRGTGTQYRSAVDGDNPHQFHTTPTGSPILLRGTLWPETPATGFLHRSPPIEGTGETRLVLVLDPIEDPEDAI